MTCFWDSIYSQLDLEDYKYIGIEKPSNIRKLIHTLKSKNKSIDHVTWQKVYLSLNEKGEHYTAIEVYDMGGIKNGHLTSVCDSFLLLICELFDISITHKFMNTNIMYENTKHSRKTLKFTSNSGHFQNAYSVNKNIKTTQSRLDRIKEKAVHESKQKKKRPSWRAQPNEYLAWRENMRNMKIR